MVVEDPDGGYSKTLSSCKTNYATFCIPNQLLVLQAMAPIIARDPTYAGVCLEITDNYSEQLNDILRPIIAEKPGFRIGVNFRPRPFYRPNIHGYQDIINSAVAAGRLVGRSIGPNSFIRYSDPIRSFPFHTNRSVIINAARLTTMVEFDSMNLILCPSTEWDILRDIISRNSVRLSGVKKLEISVNGGRLLQRQWEPRVIIDFIKEMPDIETLHISDPKSIPHHLKEEVDESNVKDPNPLMRALTVSLVEFPTTPGILKLVSDLESYFEVSLQVMNPTSNLTVYPYTIDQHAETTTLHARTIHIVWPPEYDLKNLFDSSTLLRSVRLDISRSVSLKQILECIVTCLQPRVNIEVVEITTTRECIMSHRFLLNIFNLLEKHPAMHYFALRCPVFCYTFEAEALRDTLVSLFRNNPRLQTLHLPLDLACSTPRTDAILEALASSSVTSIAYSCNDAELRERVSEILCQNRIRAETNAHNAFYYAVCSWVRTHSLFDPNLLRIFGSMI